MRKKSTNKKDGIRKRRGTFSRRALLTGLGSGLALTALGAQEKRPKGSVSPFSTIVDRTRGSGSFKTSEFKTIEADTTRLTINYAGTKSSFTDAYKLKLDFESRKFSLVCIGSLTPTPNP